MKKTLVTILTTILVTIGVMLYAAFRCGFVTAAADVETYEYETYCNGNLIDRHYEQEVKGTNVNIDLNKRYYLSR